MGFDLLFYLVGLAAVLIAGIGKGAFGGGLAFVSVPLMATVGDPVDAVVVLAPLMAVADLFTLRVHPPKTWSKPDLGWIVPGVLVGMAAGALVFAQVDGRLVGLLIGVMALGFALRWFLAPSAPPQALPVSPPRALLWGFAGGFTTFVANAGQPPVAMYLMRRGLPKATYVGTMAAVFTVANVARLPMLGPLIGERSGALVASLILLPAVPFGVWLGKRLHDRLDRHQILAWSHGLLAVTGGKLFFDFLQGT